MVMVRMIANSYAEHLGRPQAILLAAVAGFFTFGGIGLIVKGHQLEGGIALIVGLLNLIPSCL